MRTTAPCVGEQLYIYYTGRLPLFPSSSRAFHSQVLVSLRHNSFNNICLHSAVILAYRLTTYRILTTTTTLCECTPADVSLPARKADSHDHYG